MVSKKHDYHNKINSNKRSIEHLKTFLDTIKSLFTRHRQTVNEGKSIKDIESYISVLEKELESSEDAMIEQINSSKLTVKELFSARKKDIKKKKIEENRDISSNHGPTSPRERENKKQVLFPKLPELRQNLKSMNKQRLKDNDIGIFNKYEYFNAKVKSPLPKNKNEIGVNAKKYGSSSTKMVNIKQKLANEDNLNDNELEVDIGLNYDFDHTTEENYLTLCHKKEQLEKMSTNIIKNIKENERIYEKKFKEVEKTIELSKKQLKDLQEENELIKLELSDLQKLIHLKEEENKIKVEVKIDESRLIKESNNISQTRNEILQDLKIIKSEEDKLQKSIKLKKENNVIIEDEVKEESEDDEINISKNDSERVKELDEDSNLDNEANLSNLKKKYNVTEKQNTSFNNLQLENTSNLILNNIDI